MANKKEIRRGSLEQVMECVSSDTLDDISNGLYKINDEFIYIIGYKDSSKKIEKIAKKEEAEYTEWGIDILIPLDNYEDNLWLVEALETVCQSGNVKLDILIPILKSTQNNLEIVEQYIKKANDEVQYCFNAEYLITIYDKY